jgi:hypothetical protein
VLTKTPRTVAAPAEIQVAIFIVSMTPLFCKASPILRARRVDQRHDVCGVLQDDPLRRSQVRSNSASIKRRMTVGAEHRSPTSSWGACK